MRRDARHIDLQNGFLFSFFGHRQRGEQRRKQREIQHEDAGCIELVGRTPGVIPESNRGVDWAFLQVASAYNKGTTGTTQEGPVHAAVRLWYNPGRSSNKFYAPGIFVLNLSLFAPLLASLAMAKEGEEKTILQVYVSSISAHEFLLGKILASMVIGLAQWFLLMIVLFGYFGLGFAVDPTPFLIATVLYMFCVAAFGTMVGAAIPEQASAMQAVALL